jgi:hypothetical protein
MARRRDEHTSWADIGIGHAGLKTTMRALEFAFRWGMVNAVLGGEPESVDEYAEVTQTPRATAFRLQKAFRQAFPMETTPDRMNKVSGLQERYDEIAKQWGYNIRKAEGSVGERFVFALGAAIADV